MLAAQGNTAVQHSLLERIADARKQSDALFDIVRPEAIYDRPIPERHRIIFYVGIWKPSTGIFCTRLYSGSRVFILSSIACLLSASTP